MFSLFFRNVFYTLLKPGLVAGLIPYWIARDDWRTIRWPLTVSQYTGFLVFLLGLVIMVICITRFAVKGLGTLSPIDPTRRLVMGGLYQYSRNPMYIGVLLMLIGESIFIQNFILWFYMIAIFIVFNGFILFVEEPRLEKDFGKEYKEYRLKVRRWI